MRLGRVWATATAAIAAIAAPCLWFAVCTNAETAADVGATFGDQQQQATDGAADASRSRNGPPPAQPLGGGNESTAASLGFANDSVPGFTVEPACEPSVLYKRVVDPSRYQFGCGEIEVRVLISLCILVAPDFAYGKKSSLIGHLPFDRVASITSGVFIRTRKRCLISVLLTL